MAYEKQTWDTTSIFNPTRMNHIEQGIYDTDLTGGGSVNGTLGVRGNLNIDRRDGTTSTVGDSILTAGNNIPQGTEGNSRGILRLWNALGARAQLYPPTSTSSSYNNYLPSSGGTLLNSNNIVNSLVTYNSSQNGFVLTSGVQKPPLNQLTFIARNISSGAIYALWWDDANSIFKIGATISGSAPSNGNQCAIQYMV